MLVLKRAILATLITFCATAQAAVPAPRDSVATAMRSGRYALALSLLDAGAQDGDTTTWKLRRALCLLRLGNAREADALFSEVDAPRHGRTYLQFWRAEARAAISGDAAAAEAYRSLAGRADGALADSALARWLRAAATTGNAESANRAAASLVSRGGDLAAAGYEYRLAAALAAGDERAWRATWEAMLQQMPRTEQTRRAAAVALQNGWQPSGSWRAKLARMFEWHGDRESAVTTWEGALEDPYYAGREIELRYRIAKNLVDLRRYSAAVPHLRRALEDETDRTWRPRLLRLYAKLERRRNHETASRARERQFITEFPGHEDAPDALWNIGMSFERVGKLDDAIGIYRELHRRFPRSEEAGKGNWRIGFCLYRRGEYVSAYERFSELAGTSSDFVIADQASYWAGKSLHAAGREREAFAVWDLAAAYSPRSYYSVASAVRAGRAVTPPEDEELTEDRLPAGPPHWPAYAEANWLATLGEWRFAREALTRSAARQANSVPEKERLADVFERIGDYAQSIRWRWRAMWSRTTADRYYRLPPQTLRRVWPDFFRREVLDASDRTGVSPHLIWAIIRQESIFDAEVTSRADARGLMQIIPPTGRELARRMGIRDFSPEDLYDPGLNVKMGSLYVSQLLDRFGGRTDLVAAGYNAGPHNARRWHRAHPDDADVFRELITYSETRKYVKLVLKNYHIYAALYPLAEQESPGRRAEMGNR